MRSNKRKDYNFYIFLKKMIKARKHFKTIMRHKWYVMVECFKVGLYRQGIVHDLSKFSPTEFLSSARYFQGDKSPTEKERIER